MKWLGLTGGIASGKSTVARLLRGDNIPVIDADHISHEMTQIGADGYLQIVHHFGQTILTADGQINRKLLGSIIFNSEERRRELESILHPLVQQKVKDLRREYQDQGHQLCVYDVPLLFEKDLKKQFDLTILIYAPLSLQIKRLIDRNQLTHAEALARLRSQVLLREKVKWADFCIDNSTHFEDLELQTRNLIKTLRQMA